MLTRCLIFWLLVYGLTFLRPATRHEFANADHEARQRQVSAPKHKEFEHRHYFCLDLGKEDLGHASIEIRDSMTFSQPADIFEVQSSKFVIQTVDDSNYGLVTEKSMNEGLRRAPSGIDDHGPVVPNVTDKESIVNLAKMTSDAYILDPRQPNWLNTTLGFNFTCRFGWDEDGLRGHIFTTEDNTTVVVAFKGTTIDPREETPAKDRLNDNRLFSCCCGAQQPYHYTPVCNCSTGYFQCNLNCLTNSLLQNDTYYNVATQLMDRIKAIYPNAELWTVGHSLGGSIASLVGLTYNIPAVTFEAPPERLPAQRLGLIPLNTSMAPTKQAMRHHFGNTADPVFMGACNGFFSSCAFAGFSFESQCFSGKRCQYDTVNDKGWRVSITNHRINHVIDNVLKAYDEVPICEVDDDCEDCFNWKFS